MSIKWTNSETGILRKSEFKEKKEELFVFGYSCKLFRDDDRALLIDQGKHLIPWMGDETLKIDRYDARGALHDLSTHDAPPGGFDWRVELTKTEYEVEQLCDEERYRALHTNEDEEEMYKEEELKRLHAAGYGQVGFNYNEPAPAEPVTSQPAEVDEPFVPDAAFAAMMPEGIVFPESLKQNAIIEKTAKFIASQGAQMEILIKAKQRDNAQFKFLNKDDVLNKYYMALIGLVKAGKWPEKEAEVIEEKPPEPEEYLHPSLASTVIESAPSIPSIQYKPSADCDYTMLICKMRGTTPEAYTGDLPPPGTEPPHQISRPPVMYNTQAPAPPPTSAPHQPAYTQQYAAYYHQYMALTQPPPAITSAATQPVESTGLSLMKNYASGSESESESDPEPAVVIPTPPPEVQTVIDKMAAYVARNGDEFAEIVRAKNDPRFVFLEPNNEYHAFYMKLMREKRGDVNGSSEVKNKAPVSFSIKKQKDPDPILPKPALPYESSSDDDSEGKQENKEQQTTTQQQEKQPAPKEKQEKQPIVIPQEQIVRVVEQPKYTINNLPPVVVYKMEGQLTHNLPTIKTIEPLLPPKQKILPIPEIKDENSQEKLPKEEKQEKLQENFSPPKEKIDKESKRDKDRDSPHRRDKKRHKVKKDYYKEVKDKHSKDKDRDRRKDKERHDEKERDKKRRKTDNMENEIINLEDNSDELIDLTGDLSDSRGELDLEAEKAKQIERRRRATEFLKKVGVDPAAVPSLPTNSLASAMVDTLETIRKKKAAEEEKRRRREKRKRRDKRDYDESDKSHRKSKRRKYRSSEDEESDGDGSKKKKRKKDKKTPKIKKKRHSPSPIPDELKPSIDITNTLKELRTNSPTKNLLSDVTSEVGRKRREYSEGEWSSDSEDDSGSNTSKMDD